MQIKIALAVAVLFISPYVESMGIAADSLPAAVTVTNGQDDGPGSLRAAIRDATPDSTITFSFARIISLSGGELLIDMNLTIAGPGSAVLTVSRNEDFGLRLLGSTQL